MKCPFLIARKDVIDNQGRKIGEDIVLQECIKNDCMIYDGATKLCSLLSSNMKTGVLIDDLKKGIKDIKEEMHKRTETMGTTVASSMQSLQEALLSRVDILKKQNEVMVLGLDRLVETLTTRFEGIKKSLGDNVSALKEVMDDQAATVGSGIQSLKQAVDESKFSTLQVADGIKTFHETLLAALADYSARNAKASDGTLARLDQMNENVKKVSTTNQIGMETLGAAIEKTVAVNQDVVAKLEGLGNLINDMVKSEIAGLKVESLNTIKVIARRIDELSNTFSESAALQDKNAQVLSSAVTSTGDAIKAEVTGLHTVAAEILEGVKRDLGESIASLVTEVAGLKTTQIASLNNVQGSVAQLTQFFEQSSESLATMSTMMRDLNNNYIESLGKIAGLAEGMRKGVAAVGEGMHDSVKDLVHEMKSEIGALEEHYEKAFGDISNLAARFSDLNNRIKEMTHEIEKEFKDSFDRQAQLSDYTKTILEHIRDYFEKEDARYKEEQKLRVKKEGLDHFDRATLYYYRGNYEVAVNEIEKALEIEKTAEYLSLKGLLLTELGQFDESKKAYKEALKIEPNFAEIHNNLGLLYIKMKKLDDAVVSFQEAVKKNVNYARAYVNLGKAFIELEKFDEALKAYERALEIDPANVEAREAIRLYREGKIGG